MFVHTQNRLVTFAESGCSDTRRPGWVEGDSSSRKNPPVVNRVEDMFDETRVRREGKKVNHVCPISS
jgi:hypothetical protein